MKTKSHDELATTAQRLTSLIGNLQAGILVEDENRHVALTNQIFCNMFSLPFKPDQLKGTDCSGSAELTKHLFKDPDLFLNKINQLISQKRTVIGDEVELADGRFFERDYIPIFTDQVFKGHMWSYRDITQRKENEEELRKLSLVASINRNAIVFTKADADIFWCNEGFCNLTGYSCHEVYHQTPVQLLKGESTDNTVLHEMIELFRKGDPFNVELVCYRKNNSWFWGRITGQPVLDAKGNVLHYFAMIEDITKEHEAAQAIRINEEKYRNIIENMNLGLLEVDMNESIQYANHSFCQMCGYELNELIGKKASLLFARPENIELAEHKNELRKKYISDAYEIAVCNKKGETKWWLISGAPRYNDSGDLIGSIGIHLDITEQKKLETELYAARESAEQSAKTKETFLANMSHEIRTPMNAIMGMSKLMLKTELSDQQAFYLSTINKSADHLLVIINDILDISKIEAGKLNLECIGFKSENVIRHCLAVMTHRAEEKGLQLIKNRNAVECPVFIGDPHRLTQILLNLISNAIKFTEKGSITITCGLLPATADTQTLTISVKDTGIGMDKDFANGLFQKFVQADETIARRYGGTGLGMSITKHLIDLMNGSIEVLSEKDHGTEVKIAIPFLIGSSSDLPDEKTSVGDGSMLLEKKILLVEDNAINRLVARTFLQNYGAIVSEAVNGEEALSQLQKRNFDVILMDMQMPVMNGLDATKAIRSQNNQVPIIALTANAIKGESEKCFASGMNGFVSKPFEEDELIYEIAKWLKKPSDSPPLYNLSKLKSISNGNQAFLQKMVKLFIEQVPASVHEIKEAYDQKNINVIKSLAHRIKPAIDNLGIDSLHQVVRDIEQCNGNHETYDLLSRNIDALYNVVEKVRQQLEEEIAH